MPGAEWADNFAAMSIEKQGKDSDPEFFSADIDSRVWPSACFSIAPCDTAAGMSFRRQKVPRHHGTFLEAARSPYVGQIKAIASDMLPIAAAQSR